MQVQANCFIILYTKRKYNTAKDAQYLAYFPVTVVIKIKLSLIFYARKESRSFISFRQSFIRYALKSLHTRNTSFSRSNIVLALRNRFVSRPRLLLSVITAQKGSS